MILVIILIHSLVLWTLEFFLYPELLIYPYLTTAGFLPYKNILDQHFPGLMFFPVNFYSLGFNNQLAFKTLLVLIVAIQSLLLYKIAKRLGNHQIAILSSLSYLIWQPFFEGNQLWLDIFLPLFTLPAFWFSLNNQWFLTGLFMGLGIVFKQTQVPLAALIGLLIIIKYKTQSLTHLARYVLGLILPSSLMLAYFYHLGILKDFWFWTVQFNLSEFAKEGSLPPRLVDLVRLSFPLAALVAAWFVIPAKHRAKLLIIWMAFTVVGGIARFGLLHLQPAVPYFAIIFGMLIYEFIKQKNKICLIGISLLVVLWLGYFYSRQKNLFQTKYFDNNTTAIVSVIKSHTQPHEVIFILGAQPHLYELTQTLPPDKTFMFQFPWFFKVAGNRILNSLKRDPPKLIVYDDSSSTDGQYMRDYGLFLISYIRAHYDLIQKIGSNEIYANRH